MIYVVATLTIKPDSKQALFDAAKACIAATHTEPGCIRYDLNEDVSNENQVIFVEQWRSREDLEAHFTMPHMRIWREAASPHIVDRKIEIIHPEKVELR